MIKLIIFDLDGVLVETKGIHFEALNKALREVDKRFVISYNDHINKFDGRPTKEKLKILFQERELPICLHNAINQRKQEFTVTLLKKKVKKDERLISIFKKLHEDYIIHIASNCVRDSVDIIIERLGIVEFVNISWSNGGVRYPKPHPEMYMRSMARAYVGARETLIVEDSYLGREGVQRSGAHLFPIDKPKDLTLEGIMEAINNEAAPRRKWKSNNLNVLVPIAGEGKRFVKAGYTFPKPLISVKGKSMVQAAIECLDIDAHYIFLVRKEHCQLYNIDRMLKISFPGCDIIKVETLTGGAACTTLLARSLIENNKQLIIANCDQIIKWDSSAFMYAMQGNTICGGILTFENTHPKWSYAKIDKDGYVCEVAEKKPISKHATVGVYYWKRGKDYVRYAYQMIEKNITTNNEFYVCPVYNEAIDDSKKIKIWDVDEMHGLGTPEDMEEYLK